ncbi:hypothetical protein [Jeotgalibacillus haloalkalitolerans]|uniref:YozE SAM-like domain-containing protein n=1 Tax=Jeotgalibacillus haloalkalitolerans TaxID=3104292 RepID=A0ABU5KKL3_9BACL|nr:hypothetical protein [Jeotgalibacillus sp. HH7-29]MDZ5711613.1 hypothetical protein [Jeotgalibacillus sp. HH7-29]
MDINDWIKEKLEGSGGLNDYRYYEMAVFDGTPEREGATWILRCLGNPECEGSQEVLDSIIENRKQDKED